MPLRFSSASVMWFKRIYHLSERDSLRFSLSSGKPYSHIFSSRQTLPRRWRLLEQHVRPYPLFSSQLALLVSLCQCIRLMDVSFCIRSNPFQTNYSFWRHRDSWVFTISFPIGSEAIQSRVILAKDSSQDLLVGFQLFRLYSFELIVGLVITLTAAGLRYLLRYLQKALAEVLIERLVWKPTETTSARVVLTKEPG